MRLRIGFGGTIEAAVLVSASAMMGTDLAPRNDIVISEVSYNPPAALGADDEYEFVELANRGSNAVDVSGWQLKDRDDFHSYYLPAGTEIPSGGFLVIARDCAALRQAYGAEVPCVGGVAFPLGNDGDTVRILDGAGRLVDQVTYLDERPWPFEADGVDATLERISLAEDITDFSNFASSEPNATAPGTPGRVNSRAGSLPARHQVVINEIQYNPVRAPAVDPLRHCPGEEFVELHNRGAAAADVSGWRFEEGISYTIPAGTQISAGGYLVIYPDRAAFESKYGILDNAIGPYGGQLDDGGERLLLADAASNVVDSVEYNDAYPWPVNPDGLSGSLELMDPTSDNDRGQAWRESVDFRGTPGERNSAAAALDSGGGNAGPQITQVAAMANGERDRRELRSTDAARIRSSHPRPPRRRQCDRGVPDAPRGELRAADGSGVRDRLDLRAPELRAGDDALRRGPSAGASPHSRALSDPRGRSRRAACGERRARATRSRA
jgi:hypothetical protein